jgi:hypothetical protein
MSHTAKFVRALLCLEPRLDYGDIICDGFYEPLGDFPEIVEKGNFPTLGQLRHVQSFEQDPREVSTSSSSSNDSSGTRLHQQQRQNAAAAAECSSSSRGSRAVLR